MPDPVVDNVDPFLDEHTQLQLGDGPRNISDLQPESPELNPEIVTNLETPEAEVETATLVDEPQTFEYEDGSSIKIDKKKGSWRAILDSGTGAPAEVFYGNTKDELLQNVMAAKIQATKKIREQNREIKLGKNQPQVTQRTEEPRTHALTADDIQDLKLKLADNPALAFDTYVQKETGFTLTELKLMALEGRRASQKMAADEVSRAFVNNVPDYFVSPANAQAVQGWLTRYKLNKILNDNNWDVLTYELYDKGLWTLDNLVEAYEDLRDNNLLESKSATEVEKEEEAEAVPPPAPVTRQLRGTGLRVRELRGGKPTPASLPAPTNLDSLSDKEIEDLLAGVRRLPRQSIQESLDKNRQRRV